MANEDPEPKSGQLIRPEPPLPLTARTGQQRTIDWLLSKISIWPFRNRSYVQALNTATEVIEKRTKLEETIIGHGKTRAKLNDLGTIIARDKLQRQRELLEEQQRLSAVLNETMLAGEIVDEKNQVEREKLRVERMKLEKESAQLQKDIDELKPPPPPEPPPKKKTTRGRSPKQKKREEVLTRYEKEMARIEAMRKTDRAKATLRKAAEKEKEDAMAEIEKMP